MSRSLSPSLSGPDQISNYNRLDRSSRFVIVEQASRSRYHEPQINSADRSVFLREKEKKKKKKKEGKREREDIVYIVDRFKTGSRKGFSIKSPGGWINSGEIQKFGKREPLHGRMKTAVAGSYLGIQLLDIGVPLETRITRIDRSRIIE